MTAARTARRMVVTRRKKRTSGCLFKQSELELERARVPLGVSPREERES